MGGAASRRKGHRWEREVAIAFRAALGLSSDDVKRGLSQPRGGGAEEPDVTLPASLPFWIECKRGRRTNPRAALAQAREDMAAAEGRGCVPLAQRVPLAVCKDDHEPAFVALPFDAFLDLVAAAHRADRSAA